VPDYVKHCVTVAFDIHLTQPNGDVLIFLTGEDEIEEACAMLRDMVTEETEFKAKALGGGNRGTAGTHTSNQPSISSRLVICPLYAGLPPNVQKNAFEPPPRNTRKVVIASNVAETSVTIPGVVYVVDCLFAKQKVYDAKRGNEALVTTCISKASANQRAGRAGRIRPGYCYRLCTELGFDELTNQETPEMVRSDLTSTVLRLKALGVDNVVHFEWLSPPPAANILTALELLYALGALDDDARLTKLVGNYLAELPLEPQLGKALLVSQELGCTSEMLPVASYLQIQSPWVGVRGAGGQVRPCAFPKSDGAVLPLTLVTVRTDYLSLFDLAIVQYTPNTGLTFFAYTRRNVWTKSRKGSRWRRATRLRF
jgi:ATP-dependent RNA helicase DDX35